MKIGSDIAMSPIYIGLPDFVYTSRTPVKCTPQKRYLVPVIEYNIETLLLNVIEIGSDLAIVAIYNIIRFQVFFCAPND